MWKYFLGISLFSIVFLVGFGCQPTDNPNEIAILKTSMGPITIKFYPEVAPGHVLNFKKLAKKGFYDGTTFHRVIPDFMIQGGDPNTKDDDPLNDGYGGPGYFTKAEFNNKHHLRGTVSMARGDDPDSAGSQFFICLKTLPELDGQYTIFGEVVSGMDVVDKIAALETDSRDNPKIPVYVEKVLIEKVK